MTKSELEALFWQECLAIYKEQYGDADPVEMLAKIRAGRSKSTVETQSAEPDSQQLKSA